MIVGYARVSTTDQNLEVQLDELKAHGCERIFTDKATGTNTARAGLTDMMEFARDGDTLVVTRLDRFARSLTDLYALLERLTARGVPLSAPVHRHRNQHRQADPRHLGSGCGIRE